MNLSTILIGLVVLAVFAAIVVSEVRKRKKGGGCGCGCNGCPRGGPRCHALHGPDGPYPAQGEE